RRMIVMAQDQTWEAVYRAVVMAGRPQHLNDLSTAYSKYFQSLDEVSRGLRSILARLDAWQGGGADEYRNAVSSLIQDIDNFYTKTYPTARVSGESAEALSAAMSEIPV